MANVSLNSSDVLNHGLGSLSVAEKNEDTNVNGEASTANITSSDAHTKPSNSYISNEELIVLIRAVKFAKPDASIRTVHDEITTQMSQTENFRFLSNVQLNDVKKVWKKALTGGGVSSTSPSDANKNNSNKGNCDSSKTNVSMNVNITTTTTSEGNNTKSNDESSSSRKVGNDKLFTGSNTGGNNVIKFYTVGDGSIQTLAKNYTMSVAASSLAQKDSNNKEEDNDEDAMKNYVHCFLDVPCDRSGSKPYQALVNFISIGDKRKKSKKGSNSSHDDGREIVKIQVAANVPGMDVLPMLLYNRDRSAKTFIHKDDADDEGYDKIRDLVVNHGVGGVLSQGGVKAYFYARITRREGEKDIISVDVSGLAPVQTW